MDGDRFDALARTLAAHSTRRRALTLIAASLTGLASRLALAPTPAAAQDEFSACGVCWETCDALNSPEGNAVGCTIVATQTCKNARGRAVVLCGVVASTICNYVGTVGCPGACEQMGCVRRATNCDPVCQVPNDLGGCRDTCPGTRKCDRRQCRCPAGETPCGEVACCGGGQCCRNGVCVGQGDCGPCMACRARDRECVHCAYFGQECDEATGRCRPCDLEGKCEVLSTESLRCVDACARQRQVCCPNATGRRCYDPNRCETCENGRVSGCGPGQICCKATLTCEPAGEPCPCPDGRPPCVDVTAGTGGDFSEDCCGPNEACCERTKICGPQANPCRECERGIRCGGSCCFGGAPICGLNGAGQPGCHVECSGGWCPGGKSCVREGSEAGQCCHRCQSNQCEPGWFQCEPPRPPITP